MIEADLTPSDSTSAETGAHDSVEFQRSISDGFKEIGGGQNSTSKSLRLYCFACHRMEYHYNALKGTSYHHLLVGLTFGLAYLFGPYRCRCCGYRRLCRFNFLNPRFHFHKWKYSAKTADGKAPSSSRSSRLKEPDTSEEVLDISSIDDDQNSPIPKRRRKKKKLKSVPQIDSIGKNRKEQAKLEQYTQSAEQTGLDFSIEGIVDSFETEESRKERLSQIEAERASRDPFIAKKAKPRKRLKGKPKRRHARKEKLSGPKVYCFSCKQKNEHYHVLKGSTYYSFLFGISFGLSSIVGPFRCSVCSKKRMSGTDVMNPRYILRHYLENSKSGYG